MKIGAIFRHPSLKWLAFVEILTHIHGVGHVENIVHGPIPKLKDQESVNVFNPQYAKCTDLKALHTDLLKILKAYKVDLDRQQLKALRRCQQRM